MGGGGGGAIYGYMRTPTFPVDIQRWPTGSVQPGVLDYMAFLLYACACLSALQ